MQDDPRCQRCGSPLRVERVQVPVYIDTPTSGGGYAQVLARYETREEVSDCPRCHGAY